MPWSIRLRRHPSAFLLAAQLVSLCLFPVIDNTGNGRLIKADFGWSTPKAMQPMLDQYKGTTDNCART